MPALHPLIAARVSRRVIDPDRDLGPGVLERILHAAQLAASRNNVQPWRFLVFTRDQPEARAAAEDLLARGNSWAKAAPVLLLSVAVTTWPSPPGPGKEAENRHAAFDVGQATASAHIQATAEGLVFHQMAGYDDDAARQRFGLPPEALPLTMIAIGYPLDAAYTDERTAAKDAAPRTRMPISTVCFSGSWGVPFDPQSTL